MTMVHALQAASLYLAPAAAQMLTQHALIWRLRGPGLAPTAGSSWEKQYNSCRLRRLQQYASCRLRHRRRQLHKRLRRRPRQQLQLQHNSISV